MDLQILDWLSELLLLEPAQYLLYVLVAGIAVWSIWWPGELHKWYERNNKWGDWNELHEWHEYWDSLTPPKPAFKSPATEQAIADCTMLRQSLKKTASAICVLVMQDSIARIACIKNSGDTDAVFTELLNEYNEYPQKFAANNKTLQTHMQDYTRFFSHLANEAKRLSLPEIEYNQIYVDSSLAKLNDVFSNFSSPVQIGS